MLIYRLEGNTPRKSISHNTTDDDHDDVSFCPCQFGVVPLWKIARVLKELFLFCFVLVNSNWATVNISFISSFKDLLQVSKLIKVIDRKLRRRFKKGFAYEIKSNL